MQTRVAALVQRMAGNRDGGAAMIGVARLDFEVIVPHAAEQGLGKIVRYRRQPRTFENLAAVKRQAFIEAAQDRQRGKNRVVARAAGDDDVGACVERSDERLSAHLCHDGTALIDGPGRQRAVRPQTLQRRLRHTPFEIGLVDFGADDGHAEFHAVFPGKLMHELDGLRQRGVAAARQR